MGRGAELRRGLGLEPLGGSVQVTNPTPTLTLTPPYLPAGRAKKKTRLWAKIGGPK